MAGTIEVTVVSMNPGSATWESRVVKMTTAIVLPDESEEPFGDEETGEWTKNPARPGARSCDESAL
jgi:hypothetical protein